MSKSLDLLSKDSDIRPTATERRREFSALSGSAYWRYTCSYSYGEDPCRRKYGHSNHLVYRGDLA